jgi:hypothetical protein
MPVVGLMSQVWPPGHPHCGNSVHGCVVQLFASGAASGGFASIVPGGESIVIGESIVPGGESIVPGGESIVPLGESMVPLPDESIVELSIDSGVEWPLAQAHNIKTIVANARLIGRSSTSGPRNASSFHWQRPSVFAPLRPDLC